MRFAPGINDGARIPKQFLELCGNPIYVWSLTTLLSVEDISRIVIVVPAEMVAEVSNSLRSIAQRFPNQALDVVPGGDTRQASVFSGLNFLSKFSPDYVLVHDAARPFITVDIVRRVIDGITEFGACTTGVGPSDTIKRTNGNLVCETLNRDELIQVQTPQGAHFLWLLDAHAQASRFQIATTDDAAVLELAGRQVGIVNGAIHNFKITQPEDLIFAEALATIVFADRL